MKDHTEPGAEHIPEHVSESLAAIFALRQRTVQKLNRHQRTLEWMTHCVGSPAAVYSLAAAIAAWLAFNAAAPLFRVQPVDSAPFFWIQMLLTVYSALITTTVLATQNRQARERQQRAYLEFHVNLLVEQRTAKIIALLEELRRDLPSVQDRVDHVAIAMQETVDPTTMLSAIEEAMEHDAGTALTTDGRSTKPTPQTTP